MYSALDIADFFIQLAISQNDNSMDNLKINKMLFFAQGHMLAITGKPLFSEDIEAWDYGPVVPSVYKAFKCCGKNQIESPCEEFSESDLDPKTLNILIDVFMKYGQYTGIALKDMTHKKGTPWDIVYQRGKNNIISMDIMTDYFTDRELPSFEITDDESKFITEVPLAWDSEEDTVYDSL